MSTKFLDWIFTIVVSVLVVLVVWFMGYLAIAMYVDIYHFLDSHVWAFIAALAAIPITIITLGILGYILFWIIVICLIIVVGLLNIFL